MYKSIYSHYQKSIENSQSQLSFVKKKLYTIGTIRLILFIATILLAYFLRTYGGGVVIATLLIGLIVFFVLVVQYNKYHKKKDYLETSIACNENELKALDYDFSAFDGAPEKINANHNFSLDLDIFGKNSLFQAINRTCTNFGKKVLIEWFEKPLRDSQAIENRQEAIRELSKKPSFTHHFQVIGLTHPGKDSDYSEIKEFIESPDFITSRKLWKFLYILIPLLWIISIILVSTSVIHGLSLVWIYIVTLLISEVKAKQVNHLQRITGKKVNILHSYSGLIQAVEQEEINSPPLKELQAVFLKNGEKASIKFKKLAQLANELEQRANLLIHLLFNPLLLWDIKKSIQLEEWKEKQGKNLIDWIETLGKFDSYCSLGIFSFNHPDYIFPTLTDSYFEMEGKELGHPLLNRNSCITNDIEIQKHPFFLIITGANMAGKSTYLRTVGVNFFLACIGAPVYAKSLSLYPAQLITSLRTSDSLNDNESYFFAELKRLKMIIDELHAGEKLFIVLDEILKGTNSIDKQKGSLALIQQFLHLNSCGIIATHDLLLGSLEKQFPDNVKNYRFEADIQNDKLSFSYKLREGIAQNMNASFLMQKMGITISEK